jgi:iron(III) transport system substrate-binding protein
MIHRQAKMLATAALAAVMSWQPAVAQSVDELYAKAKEEGELTWYTSHAAAEVMEAFGNLFTELYPGVEVNVVRTTAQVAFQRLQQDLQNQQVICDVFSSTDVGHYAQLKEEGLLAQYAPPNADKVYEVFQGFDPDGYYHVTSSGMVALTYNSDLVSDAEAPTNWPDLLDPKWKGKVSVGHPAYSGYVGTWVVTMRKLYGWDYFEQLEKTDPRIGRSINDTVTMLTAKESAVAAGPDATTAMSAARGNPLKISYPTDGALLMIAPSSVLKNAPHPNAARLFLNFLLSKEAGELGRKSYFVSLRPDVAPAPGFKPLSEIKTVRPTFEEIKAGIPDVIEAWRDTFGN